MRGPLKIQTQTSYPNDGLIFGPYFLVHDLPIHIQPYIPIPVQPSVQTPP
jgi:hypothetical protein